MAPRPFKPQGWGGRRGTTQESSAQPTRLAAASASANAREQTERYGRPREPRGTGEETVALRGMAAKVSGRQERSQRARGLLASRG